MLSFFSIFNFKNVSFSRIIAFLTFEKGSLCKRYRYVVSEENEQFTGGGKGKSVSILPHCVQQAVLFEKGENMSPLTKAETLSYPTTFPPPFGFLVPFLLAIYLGFFLAVIPSQQ